MYCVRLIAAMSCALFLAGCSVGADGDYGFKPHDDPFRPYAAVIGAPVTRTVSGLTQPLTRVTVALEARRDRKTHVQTLHANVQIHYVQHGMRRYSSARNIRAEILPLQFIKHTSVPCRLEPGCPHTEWVLIDLNEAELRSAIATGFSMKVFGAGAEDIGIALSSEMLKSFFLALDKPAATTAAAPSKS